MYEAVLNRLRAELTECIERWNEGDGKGANAVLHSYGKLLLQLSEPCPSGSWGEFKRAVETLGVTDSMLIDSIHVYGSSYGKIALRIKRECDRTDSDRGIRIENYDPVSE